MKFGETFFQTKLLSRLSHRVYRRLSSPVLLRKLTNHNETGTHGKYEFGNWSCFRDRYWRRAGQLSTVITVFIQLHEKFLQFDWLRAVVFKLNLKYLHLKITKLLRVVV